MVVHSRLPHMKNIIVRHVCSTSSFVKPYFQQLEILFFNNFQQFISFFKAPCSTIDGFAVIVFGEAGRTSRKTSGRELFDAFDIKKHPRSLNAARRPRHHLNFNNFQQLALISMVREPTRTSRNPQLEPRDYLKFRDM